MADSPDFVFPTRKEVDLSRVPWPVWRLTTVNPTWHWTSVPPFFEFDCAACGEHQGQGRRRPFRLPTPPLPRAAVPLRFPVAPSPGLRSAPCAALLALFRGVGPSLSSLEKKWALRDSNPRPAGCKPAALTN